MRRFVAVVPIAMMVALVVAASEAEADGLPVPMDGIGVTTTVAPSGGGPRYASVAAGGETQLLRIDQDGGEVTASRATNGEFTIPVVALDGASSGLSADGTTLALIVPRTNFRRFPRRETTFRIVDLRKNRQMRPGKPLTLRGDFSFDALSPDGRTMYLVQYTSSDYNDYKVREYDLVRRRLVDEPVQFSHEVAPGEMRGLPMARATSSDGRWAYTLYNGGGRKQDVAFIHILDTVDGVSHCIELPNVSGQEAWNLKLALTGAGRALTVKRGNHLVASMDTKTLGVSEPPWPRRPAATKPADGRISGLAIGAITGGVTLIVATAFTIRRRRRPLPLPADPFEPGAGVGGVDAEPAVHRHAEVVVRAPEGDGVPVSRSSTRTSCGDAG